MRTKFKDDFAAFRELIEKIDDAGTWSMRKEAHVYRTLAGAIVNWWPKTGTVNVQGETQARDKMDAAISNALKGSPNSSSETSARKPPPNSLWRTFHVVLKIKEVS